MLKILKVKDFRIPLSYDDGKDLPTHVFSDNEGLVKNNIPH